MKTNEKGVKKEGLLFEMLEVGVGVVFGGHQHPIYANVEDC